MIKSYFITTIRNLIKKRSFSLINITGLAIGMAVSFLILLFVLNEITYDRFHRNSADIYRIAMAIDAEGRHMEFPMAPGPMGPTLMERYPEVKNFFRLREEGRTMIAFEQQTFEENRVYYADPSLFEMLTIQTMEGDSGTFLDAPYSAVLTQETARKYFGDENPLGKMIKMDNRHDFTVTGIVKKMPENSHFKFNILASFSTLERTRNDVNQWMGFNFITYIQLEENISLESLTEKYYAMMMDNIPDMIKKMDIKIALFLQPLVSIHLHSHLEEELETPGNPAFIRLLTTIALFILLIACINFMNLSTAQSSHRAKEVGMRKVLGAHRGRLVGQFLGESLLLSYLALIVAVILIMLLLPVFNQLVDKDLAFNPAENSILLFGLLGITTCVGLLAGLYPALFLSSFLPLEILKARFRAGKGHKFFRNGLVSLQYIISITLICGTLVIFSQLRHIKNYDLGFDREQTAVLRLQGEISKQKDAFKTEILQIPGVLKAAISSTAPGMGRSETFFTFEGIAEGGRQVLPFMEIDEDYLETMGIRITQGRNFSREFPSDNRAVILNQTLAGQLGWENPIGKTVNMMDIDEEKEDKIIQVPYTVIGVIQDFHFESLHQKIRGQIMKMSGDAGRITIKMSPENLSDTINRIEAQWKQMEPRFSFQITFLDDTFDRYYRSEEQMGKIFISFTSIAILVACLGLFGLASFTAEQRTKEIGIRKILGASVSNVVYLLSRDLTRWVLLANVIAWPVAYFAMNKWLQNFAYRIGIGFWMFVVSGAAALLIAILTVSIKTLKTAASNPVDSLRYE